MLINMQVCKIKSGQLSENFILAARNFTKMSYSKVVVCWQNIRRFIISECCQGGLCWSVHTVKLSKDIRVTV